MGNLSKNFSRHEFACRCCGELKINQELIDALQALRDLIQRPIHINSGYRCPRHNAEVGGVKNSQHLLGNAADIVIYRMTVVQMRKYAEQIEAFTNGGIGIYPSRGFIHVDVRGKRARWEK